MRLALIGTGRIARRFAADLRHSNQARIVAVGARTIGKAELLARAIGPGVAAVGIEEAMALPDVDAVYVATANEVHAEQALLAIALRKPVLVEKPLATRAEDAERVAEAARAAGVFAMEAMWMRFTPGIRRLKAWVGENELGSVRRLVAGVSFGNDVSRAAAGEGGALLDLGVYPISLALHLLGPAERIVATGRRNPAGVVIEAELILSHERSMSSLSCGWTGEGANRATLEAERALVETTGSMLCPPILVVKPLGSPSHDETVNDAGGSVGGLRFARGHALREMLRPFRRRRVPTLYHGTGLHYQVDHMAECLRAGLTESPVMPLRETCRALGVIEDALEQIR